LLQLAKRVHGTRSNGFDLYFLKETLLRHILQGHCSPVLNNGAQLKPRRFKHPKKTVNKVISLLLALE